jgi:hypothetical protein
MTHQQPAGGQHDQLNNHGTTSPHWELYIGKTGDLTAVLTGTGPPAITVTAPDLASLRKQIKTIIMRAML